MQLNKNTRHFTQCCNLSAPNLSELAIFLESSSQEISGEGLPVAIHLRNTDGPGCIVSSVKACLICGGSTVKENKTAQNLFQSLK